MKSNENHLQVAILLMPKWKIYAKKGQILTSM